jgi:hypothetical protein
MHTPLKKEGIDSIDQKTIDPKLFNYRSFNESNGRGSLAWFGRQTHNLENSKRKGANAQLSRGRGLESRPRHHLPVKACFLAILDKEP